MQSNIVYLKQRKNTITDLNEPVPTEEQAAIYIDIAWMQKIPIFLFWELKKQ
jgi:hypothetical protein